MLSLSVLAALGLFEAASPDSTSAAAVAVDSGAARMEAAPLPKAPEKPVGSVVALDSVWRDKVWSIGATFHTSPLQFTETGAMALESEALDNVNFQDYTFGLAGWRRLSKAFDLGIGYEHSWLLEFGGSKTSVGIGSLLTSDVVMLRGRYWLKRSRKWELGPQIGFGWGWGTLNRFAARDRISGAAEDVGFTDASFAVAKRALSVSGRQIELGLAMEVLVTPRFSIGGVLEIKGGVMTADDADPVDFSTLRVEKPKDWGAGSLGPELHAMYRF